MHNDERLLEKNLPPIAAGEDLKMYNESSKKATLKYQAKAYDRIGLIVKKGRKEIYREHAESIGYSLNGLISELLEREIGNPNLPKKDAL